MSETQSNGGNVAEITVEEHVPGSVMGRKGHKRTVKGLDQVFALPWIESHKNIAGKQFTRWSKSFIYSDYCALMAEFDDGAVWWVVAYLRSDQPIDLPIWKEPKVRRSE